MINESLTSPVWLPGYSQKGWFFLMKLLQWAGAGGWAFWQVTDQYHFHTLLKQHHTKRKAAIHICSVRDNEEVGMSSRPCCWGPMHPLPLLHDKAGPTLDLVHRQAKGELLSHKVAIDGRKHVDHDTPDHPANIASHNISLHLVPTSLGLPWAPQVPSKSEIRTGPSLYLEGPKVHLWTSDNYFIVQLNY